MRKLVTIAALLYSTAAYADDVRVSGTVSEQHIGTVLSCFVVNGQWYAIPTGMGGGFIAQSVGVSNAAGAGGTISFLADSAPAINNGNPYLCHGAVPASWAHDIDLLF